MKKSFFCLLLLSASALNSTETVFKTLKLLPPDYRDLCSNYCKQGLFNLIKSKKPKLIIELGSFMGGSAIFMAQSVDANCKVYCVDEWTGEGVWLDPVELKRFGPIFYQQFLSNVVHSGVQDKIVPFRMSTSQAAGLLDVKADIIYVDADHTEESAYNDVMLWYPKLAPGGVICGDDYTWQPAHFQADLPVKRGVDRAARELGLKVHTIGDWFWQLVKE